MGQYMVVLLNGQPESDSLHLSRESQTGSPTGTEQIVKLMSNKISPNIALVAIVLWADLHNWSRS